MHVKSLSEWMTFCDIFVNNEYDVPILLSLESGKKLNVLDIGANVGHFTLRFAHLANIPYTVTLVEGCPKLVGELKDRLLPQLSTLHIIHGLVGQRKGSARLYRSDFHGINSIVLKSGNSIEVPFIDLDNLVTDQVDLLKCDIEGSELLFIQNYPSLLRNTKIAVFELHHDECDTDSCIKILKSYQFKHKVLRTEKEYSVHLFIHD